MTAEVCLCLLSFSFEVNCVLETGDCINVVNECKKGLCVGVLIGSGCSGSGQFGSGQSRVEAKNNIPEPDPI